MTTFVLVPGACHGGWWYQPVVDRLAALVYIDAFVPADGDSCWSMTSDEQRAWYVDGAGRTGTGVTPLPCFDARTMPHPLAALVQRSRLTEAWTRVRHKHYVAAMDPDWAVQSPFVPTAQRLHADPAWTVHDLPITHNVLATGPDALLAVLLPLA